MLMEKGWCCKRIQTSNTRARDQSQQAEYRKQSRQPCRGRRGSRVTHQQEINSCPLPPEACIRFRCPQNTIFHLPVLLCLKRYTLNYQFKHSPFSVFHLYLITILIFFFQLNIYQNNFLIYSFSVNQAYQFILFTYTETIY